MTSHSLNPVIGLGPHDVTELELVWVVKRPSQRHVVGLEPNDVTEFEPCDWLRAT